MVGGGNTMMGCVAGRTGKIFPIFANRQAGKVQRTVAKRIEEQVDIEISKVGTRYCGGHRLLRIELKLCCFFLFV